MRLFLAAWPDHATGAVLEGLERPPVPGVRWSRPDQWHITLRFFGQGKEGPVEEATSAGLGQWSAGRVRAQLGPATARLGRGVLQAPVQGLDALAALLAQATGSLYEPPHPGPFRGHLTLARAREPAALRPLVGQALSAAWDVEEVTLVSSVTAREGARYEVIRRWSL